MVEHSAVNGVVTGSSPVLPANLKERDENIQNVV